jgi:hypothetical protein
VAVGEIRRNAEQRGVEDQIERVQDVLLRHEVNATRIGLAGSGCEGDACDVSSDNPADQGEIDEGGSATSGIEYEIGSFRRGEFGDCGAEVLGDTVIGALEGNALNVGEAELVGEDKFEGDGIAVARVDGEELDDGDGGMGVALAEIESR